MDLSQREREIRRTVRREWYQQLKTLLSGLEDLHDHLISNENLSRLKIGVSDLPLEVEDGSLDFGARFFAPLPPDALQTSPCTLCSNNGIHGPVFRRPESPIPSYLQSDYEEDQMYFTGRYLAKVISTHCSHTALEYSSEWRCVR